jgi:hypothetical protein
MLSKFCGLGQAGFPPNLLKCRHISGFPLNLRPPRYRLAGPDYHLVHTAIPNIFQNEQPRSFPQQSVRFLASFANKVSNSDNALAPASTRAPDPLSTIFTQGRLHCSQHQMIPPNRFNPCSWLRCSTASIKWPQCRLFFQKTGSPR